MPPKQRAASKRVVAVAIPDDVSESGSSSSGSGDDHTPAPTNTASKGGKGTLTRRMDSNLSEQSRGGPPPMSYVNQLIVDESSVLDATSDNEGVEGFCRNLVEDLAEMVQESIFTSMMDRMAVPWTVQEVILELYMGMYFSVIDRDVEFPPVMELDPSRGGGSRGAAAGFGNQELFEICDSEEEFPRCNNVDVTQQHHHMQITGAADPSPSSLVPVAAGVSPSSLGTLTPAQHPLSTSIDITSPENNNTANSGGVHTVITRSFSPTGTPRSPHHDDGVGAAEPLLQHSRFQSGIAVPQQTQTDEFYCKFEPVLFGEREAGASIDGTTPSSATNTNPAWAVTGKDTEDYWTTDSDQEPSQSGGLRRPDSSSLCSKRRVKDMPCGFVVGQKKIMKKANTSSTSNAKMLSGRGGNVTAATDGGVVNNGRSSPTAIRRQRALNTSGGSKWDPGSTCGSVSPSPSPATVSLSISQGVEGINPSRIPDETGRLIECLRAVSTRERVALETKMNLFKQGGSSRKGRRGSDDDGTDEAGSDWSDSSAATTDVVPVGLTNSGNSTAPVMPSLSTTQQQSHISILKSSKRTSSIVSPTTGSATPPLALTTTHHGVKIVSRTQSQTMEPGGGASSPPTDGNDPLGSVRRVLSDDAGSSLVPQFSPLEKGPTSGLGDDVATSPKSSSSGRTPSSSLRKKVAGGKTDGDGDDGASVSKSSSLKVAGSRHLSISSKGQIRSFRPASHGPQRKSDGTVPPASESPRDSVNHPSSLPLPIKRHSSTSTVVPSTAIACANKRSSSPGGGKRRGRRNTSTPAAPTSTAAIVEAKVSHYFYRDPLLGPHWSDVFLSVPEPPHIPPDSWSRGLLPSRRPLIPDSFNTTSLYLGGSMIGNTTLRGGSSRGGLKSSGSGRDRSVSPHVRNASGATSDDILPTTTRRRSSVVMPGITSAVSMSINAGGSRPASRVSIKDMKDVGAPPRPVSKGTKTATPDATKAPTTTTTNKVANLVAKPKASTKTPAKTTPSKSLAAGGGAPLLDDANAPKSHLALLQRLELTEEDIRIQEEEQRVRERMEELRNTSDHINKQIAALKPRTPFTVDLKTATVVVQKRPEGTKMEPVPGSICGGPTVMGGKRIDSPAGESQSYLSAQLLKEQIRRAQASNEKNAPKRRAQTAPLVGGEGGAHNGVSPDRPNTKNNNDSTQIIKIVEDVEEEVRQREELASQLEKLDLKDLRDASTAQDAINTTMSSIGGVSPVRGGNTNSNGTRPATVTEMDSLGRPRGGRKLPPSNFFEVEKRVETPMIARTLSPAGGVVTRVGEVTVANELSTPSVLPNGGRPMSRSEFNKLQQSNTQGGDPIVAKETAAYWQGELGGGSRINISSVASSRPTTGGGGSTSVAAVLPLRAPNSSTPPPIVGIPGLAAAAAGGGGTATTSSNKHHGKSKGLGLVQRLSSAVSKRTSAEEDQSSTGDTPKGAGGVRGLLIRERANTTDPAHHSRGLTPGSKQRRGVYVPPAHRVSSSLSGLGGSLSPPPPRGGRIGGPPPSPSAIVELA